ncbi:MAG: Crp/Fnr family transcriptional regulator [Myxococcales bacterium]|nr:Crp/Fnr family transcriptional regulator [Myxococcales bacterium]
MFASLIPNCRACPLAATLAGRCPFTPMQLPATAVVCGQGEYHPTSYFVREGTVALCAVDADGSERSLALRGPRSLLCLESVQGESSPYEIRTVTPAKLCSMPAQALAGWIGPEHSPARVVLELLLGEIDQRQRDVVWRRGDSLSRVARFILAWGLRAPNGRPLQKQLVARMLGMRPETFSRCLKRLVTQGLIDRGGGLRVIDAQGLAAVASSEAA